MPSSKETSHDIIEKTEKSKIKKEQEKSGSALEGSSTSSEGVSPIRSEKKEDAKSFLRNNSGTVCSTENTENAVSLSQGVIPGLPGFAGLSKEAGVSSDMQNLQEKISSNRERWTPEMRAVYEIGWKEGREQTIRDISTGKIKISYTGERVREFMEKKEEKLEDLYQKLEDRIKSGGKKEAIPSDAAIFARGLIKIYKTGELSVVALRGVDLTIPRGTINIIIGPSGCGKSTLIHIIAGLDVPSAGICVVEGKDLSNLSPKENALYRKRMVGIVFQSFNLVPHLNAIENVYLPIEMAGGKNKKKRALELLEKVGLKGKEYRDIPMLSGGEQQRVAIASALANSPSILLADEPTGELDKNTGNVILDLFAELNEKEHLTILMVTHDLRAARIADNLFLMEDGTITDVKMNLRKRNSVSSVPQVNPEKYATGKVQPAT